MTAYIDFHNVVFGDNRRKNFTPQLFRLLFKADQLNRIRIGYGFPVEAEMVRLYKYVGRKWSGDNVQNCLDIQREAQANVQATKQENLER